MTENYIFDLYGTLVDIHTDESMPSLWKRMALFYSLQGAEYAWDELHDAYNSAVHEQIEQRSSRSPGVHMDHVEPDILLVFQSLYAKKGIGLSSDQIENTALIFRTLSMRHIQLYPSAMDALRVLHERKKGVYLLSNAQSAFTIPELRKLELLSCFDGIVLSSDVGVKKPDRAIFEHLLSKFGLRPETCLMIGNDMEADMRGAASVGIAGRYIHTKQSPARPQALPDHSREIRSLRDLL